VAGIRGTALADTLAATAPLLGWAAAIVSAAILLSGVTVVKPDEVALQLRFGKLTGAVAADQVHGPGLLIALPYLIDEVVRVPVKRIHELRVDGLSARGGQLTNRLDITRHGYALTGDRNIVQVEALVKYQIADPVTWALVIRDPEQVVHEAIVAALSGTLAEMPVDAVLVEGKGRLVATAVRRAQERLDREGSWVRLLALELTALKPPAQVAPQFDEVQSAFVEAKTKVEKARSYREQQRPFAAADAESQVRQAEAYAAEQLARARGAAVAFLGILERYRENPEVVRQRLYREAMEQVLAQAGGRVLVAPGADRGRVLVPGDTTPGEW
jgi:membrane protease subunit HflK